MEIKEAQKGLSFKSAKVTGTLDKDEAFQFVLTHFRETTESLFGWFVHNRDGDSILVILYTA